MVIKQHAKTPGLSLRELYKVPQTQSIYNICRYGSVTGVLYYYRDFHKCIQLHGFKM